MEDVPAGRRSCVNVFGKGAEARALILDGFYDIKQITQASGEAVIRPRAQ